MSGHRSTRPRATRAVLITLVLGVTAGPAAAPAAAAAPDGANAISFALGGYEAGPVLTGDGRVVVADRIGNGAKRILAIDPATRAFTELVRIPAPVKPQTFHTLKLAGSGGVVTATLDRLHDVTDPDAEHATPSLESSRAFTVLPAPAPLATCDPVQASFPATIRTAGGDGFVALAADDCQESSAVHIRNPNTTLTIPAEPAGAFPPPEVSDLRAAGPFVTWTETRFDGGPRASFVAARAATGEVLLRAPVLRRYGLAADGTIVADAGGCTLSVVSLAPLAQRSAGLPGGLCPGFFGDVAVAGGRAVYPVLGGYAATDLQGSAHPVAHLPVETILPTPIAFDGRTLYGVRRRCHDEQLLAVDTTVPAGAPLPLVPPRSLETCPVKRAGAARLRVRPDRRVKIRVACPAGCRGTLRLVEQRRGRRERIVGSTDFVSPGGTMVLLPRIARYARALAGCAGGLRVAAVVHRPGDRTKGLGAYRILSRSRCRRTGGPAFAAPRAWPRP